MSEKTKKILFITYGIISAILIIVLSIQNIILSYNLNDFEKSIIYWKERSLKQENTIVYLSTIKSLYGKATIKDIYNAQQFSSALYPEKECNYNIFTESLLKAKKESK